MNPHSFFDKRTAKPVLALSISGFLSLVVLAWEHFTRPDMSDLDYANKHLTKEPQ